jgi:hypothetical protein
MHKHNGFILADVVGLGKTIIKWWLPKNLFMKMVVIQVLIVVPPAIKAIGKEQSKIS